MYEFMYGAALDPKTGVTDVEGIDVVLTDVDGSDVTVVLSSHHDFDNCMLQS